MIDIFLYSDKPKYSENSVQKHWLMLLLMKKICVLRSNSTFHVFQNQRIAFSCPINWIHKELVLLSIQVKVLEKLD
jgi:hypothetical protein